MTFAPPPMSITLFTTTQSPLPVRYPRPSAPALLLPALIHRSLHSALDDDPVSAHYDGPSRRLTVPHPDKIAKHDLPSAADQSAHELTVKVHLVGEASSADERARWVEESLELLRAVKGLGGIDSLLVGFRGIDYKGKKLAASGWGDWGCGTDNPDDEDAAGPSSETVPDPLAQQVEDTWAALEHLAQDGHGRPPRARRLGTLYMPLGMLQRLADRPVPPKINAMDTPDCHHLPKEYSDFARSKGIELWAGGGGEGADPLPAADLHNLLQEFHAHWTESLPEDAQAALKNLSAQIPLENNRWSQAVKPAVTVRWVLGYTLLSSTRNLVADKGYIISADIASA